MAFNFGHLRISPLFLIPGRIKYCHSGLCNIISYGMQYACAEQTAAFLVDPKLMKIKLRQKIIRLQYSEHCYITVRGQYTVN